MKKIIGFIAGALIFAVPLFADVIGDKSSVPQGAVTVVDNFERGNYWIWAAFDWEFFGPAKLSTSARVTNQWASEGRNSLECGMTSATPDSDRDGMYYMDYHWDFSGAKYLVFDVQNPFSSTFYIYAALQTTDSWNWHATSEIAVAPGTHTVVLDITDAAAELFLVRRINLCYKEGENALKGYFFIDNLRIIK